MSTFVGAALARPEASHAATASPNVTRQEFTVDLAQQLQLPPQPGATQVFTDLAPANPSYGLIMAAYEAGWISGYPNHTFQPGASLTREQVAKTEIIALGLQGAAAALEDKTPSYKDAGEIGKWAWGYVNEAQAIGILHGFSSDTFGPQSTFTEAQIKHAQSQMATYLASTPVKAFATAPSAAPGTALGTTAIAVTPYAAADRIAVLVSTIPLSVPTWGEASPSAATAYSPGDNLTVAPGAYVGVYEVGAQNVVSAFSQLQVTSSEVAQPPTGLSLTGPQGGGSVSSAATIGPFTLTLEDANGNPAPAPAGGETVSLASNSTGSYTFAASASGPAISSLAIPQGGTTATFYYGDTAAGAPVLLATSPSLGSTTLGVQIAAGPPAKFELTGPASGPNATSPVLGPFTLALTDAYGNPSPAPAAGVTANLGSSSPGPDEFSLSSGGPSVSSVAIPQGATSVSFYYGDAAQGQPTLTASGGGLLGATLSLQIASTGMGLTLTGPATAVAGATPSIGPFTLTLTGQGGAPVPAPATGVTVSLYSNSSGTNEFSSTPGGTPETTVVIPSGSSSASFYYGDAAQGQPTLTASGAGLLSATFSLQIASATPTGLTLTGPATGAVGATPSNGPFTVTLTDQIGAPAPAPAAGVTVSLYSNSSGTNEFSSTPAGTPETTVVIPSGSSSVTFYYGDTQPGIAAISATATGLSSASAMLEMAQTVNLTGPGFDSFSPPATTSQVQTWYGQGLRNIFLNTFATTFAQEYVASLPLMNVVLFQGYWTSAFTSETGAQRAQEAIHAAASVNYPKGAYIFVDVESTGSATEQQMITWINSWSAAAQAAGYGAGVYFGVPQPVKAADTASLLADRFWKSYSGTGITPTPRGVCVIQTGTTNSMDTDTFTTDNLGEYCVGAGL